MAKVLIVDPTDRTIREADMNGYTDMRTILPGGIAIAHMFRETTGDVLYVDDEALLRVATCAFRLVLRPDGQPMMSKGILTGRDDTRVDEESGEWIETTLDVAMKPHQLEPYIQWLALDEALQWFEERKSETSASVTSGDEVIPLTVWGQYLKAMRGK